MCKRVGRTIQVGFKDWAHTQREKHPLFPLLLPCALRVFTWSFHAARNTLLFLNSCRFLSLLRVCIHRVLSLSPSSRQTDTPLPLTVTHLIFSGSFLYILSQWGLPWPYSKSEAQMLWHPTFSQSPLSLPNVWSLLFIMPAIQRSLLEYVWASQNRSLHPPPPTHWFLMHPST